MTASLLDTNILVYANNKDSEFHALCKPIVGQAVNGKLDAVVALQNLVELYAVITDSRRVEHPLIPAKAKELIEFYQRSALRIIAPLPRTVETITALLGKHAPRSQSIFDYLLVATMLDNGIHIVYTANSAHFEHFDTITVINPLAL